jgi:hypothetical protein
MAGQYATTTEVPVERSQVEIKSLLTRYGATSTMIGEHDGCGLVLTRIYDRNVRFRLPIPDPNEDRFQYAKHATRGRVKRTQAAAEKEADQAMRSAWRSLLLVVKATLEAVAAGIVTEHEAFLAYTLLPDGTTVGDSTRPQVEAAYRDGLMPANVLAIGPAR